MFVNTLVVDSFFQSPILFRIFSPSCAFIIVNVPQVFIFLNGCYMITM